MSRYQTKTTAAPFSLYVSFLFHFKTENKTEDTLFEMIHISILGGTLDGKYPEQKDLWLQANKAPSHGWRLEEQKSRGVRVSVSWTELPSQWVRNLKFSSTNHFCTKCWKRKSKKKTKTKTKTTVKSICVWAVYVCAK